MTNNDVADLCQQAESLKAQGRFAEAATCYQAALDSGPQSVDLWWALGDLYAQTENFAGVESCCKEIVTRSPGIPEVYLYLGMALQRQEKMEEAESALNDALRLDPGLVEAYSELGTVQQSLGKLDAAIDSYRRALPAIPDRAPVLYNLSRLFHRQGHIEEAFDQAFAALHAAPTSLKYRQNFVKLLNVSAPCEVSDATHAEILKCFNTRGLGAAPMMKPCMLLLAENKEIQQAVKLAEDGALGTLKMRLTDGSFDGLLKNELLHNLLLHTKIASPEVETLLGALRRMALDDVINSTQDMEATTLIRNARFTEALASQFFNTDYAAFVTGEEGVALENLTIGLMEVVGQNQSYDKGFFARLAIFCMYKPLSSFEGVERMFETAGQHLPAALPILVERQWSDCRKERMLREDIETLTLVKAEVSTSVRDQYEKSPYPRWFSIDLCEPVSYRQFLQACFPYFDVPDFGAESIDILVAGCGTGHHAITSAVQCTNSNVLAVDLSKTSLAYAKRKADEAGVSNIKFAQADILELGSLGQRFHIIEPVGVLHHMKDPQAGLKILTDLLIDGGLMRIGLYSAYGRRTVAAARQFIGEQGFETTADGIRQARKALLALNADHPARPATRFRDFYTLCECRDLLFHVQEHRLRIPDLAALLKSCGLEFIGFTLGNPQVLALYREHYPDDIAMTNLSNWNKFEQNYPNTFEEMYQFWCQKI